jgi:hypothetical protein
VNAPAPTPAEQRQIDRFGIFAEEREAAVVDRVAVALWRSDTEDGYPDVDLEALWPKVVVNFPDDAAAYRRLAVAAVAAYRATQDGGAT